MLNEAIESDRILVLIFLDGGNDGLNTVVPLDQLSKLNQVRPRVVLPEGSLRPLPKSEVGLHPALKNFSSLYREGRLGIVQNVGYPQPNFSHFRSSDIWMSASDSNEYLSTGWGGRFLNELHPEYPETYPNETNPDPLAIEIGWGASMLFQGPTASMGMVISGPDAFYDLIDNIEQPAPETAAGDKLKFIRLMAKQSEEYGQRVKQASDNVSSQKPYSDNYISEQLRIVSRLIAGGLKTPLYLIRHGGFDTHDSQVDVNDHTQGFHTQLLHELDDAVLSFMNDLEYHGNMDRVMGMTFSEFGRTIISNASDGTDHGTAAPLFVFGNHVKGGVLGDNPYIPHNATWENDLAMEFDFRQVYSSVLQQWLGLSTSSVQSVLLKDFETLPIIGESEVFLAAERDRSTKSLRVYPNPLNGEAKVTFKNRGQAVSISLLDMQGRKVMDIYSGIPGEQQPVIPWSTHSLQQGYYFVVLQSADHCETFTVVR